MLLAGLCLSAAVPLLLLMGHLNRLNLVQQNPAYSL